jgi:hypothetical protein
MNANKIFLNHNIAQKYLLLKTMQENNPIDPAHYPEGIYEPIKVIHAWNLSFCLGNTLKYIARAGKKDPDKEIEDLEKGVRYMQREIQKLKEDKLKNKQ